LPLLGEEPFIVVNGDIWTDYRFSRLQQALQPERMAHLVLVPNPPQHPDGDFTLQPESGCVHDKADLTFSGIGVYRPALFADKRGAFGLAPLLRAAMESHAISGEQFSGRWFDVGTPERLTDTEQVLKGIKPNGANLS